MLGEVLRAAIGNSASDYMNAKVWQGFGMQHRGNWMQSAPFGGETGGCCISASIRDYARLGIFGQYIYVDPARDIVISMHSNAPAATDTNYHAHTEAVMRAIAQSFDS